MKMPDCFYQKAFWIVIPLLVGGAFAGMSALNAQIDAIDDRVTKNQVTIAENNVPALREFIAKEFDKIEANQEKLRQNQEKMIDNQILIFKHVCKITAGDC